MCMGSSCRLYQIIGILSAFDRIWSRLESKLMIVVCMGALTLSAPALFLARCKSFFLENLYLASFLCWRDISRDLFFKRRLWTFFHIGVKKLKNQVRNEIFRQMSLTLTLLLDVLVRPMDAKGLRTHSSLFLLYKCEGVSFLSVLPLPRGITGMRTYDSSVRLEVTSSSSKTEEVEFALQTLLEAASWMDGWLFTARSMMLPHCS